VGANKVQPLRARLIAASNSPLEEEVAGGRFRADLYYRLNVVSFFLPPLRERRAAVAALARKFLQEFTARNRPDLQGLSEEALVSLETYHWPGNVRQLRNVIERALIIAEGRMIRKGDLPDAFRTANTSAGSFIKMPLGSSLHDVEKEMIIRTIEFTGGNKTRAAEILGVSSKTLYNKLEQYELER
jgi:two-component system response regulator HydG